MGKKNEVINNTDVDEVNSIKSDDDNVMENIKDLVANLSKKGKKKKSKKEEEIVIDEDDSEDDDSEDDDSEDDDSDSEDDDDSEEEGDDDELLNNNGIAVVASLIQESFYDSEGVSIGESLSKIANLMEKFYNLEKKKYQKNKD
jgi:hypothetical protein